MLSAVFTYLFGILRSRNKSFLNASKFFSDAFIDEIQLLKEGRMDAYKILKPSFQKHERAAHEFRGHLKKRALREFDEAWREYYCYTKNNPMPFPEQYFAAGNLTAAAKKRELALGRIARLLSFARLR